MLECLGIGSRSSTERPMLDDHDHHDSCCGTDRTTTPAGASSRLSRRRMLGAMALGAGAVGLSRLPAAANSTSVSTLEGPGEALEAAERRPHPVPTTTTTTVPIDPPRDGEILFPIMVGPDDGCYVLDNYGDCRSGCSRLHEGVDMMADPGLPVLSVSAGVITKIYTDRGLTYGAGNGWTIYDEENEVHYRYFHLRDLAPGLEEGSEVALGQIIGSVGETGTTGNGNPTDNFHLHFEWRPNNIARDSFPVLQRTPYVDFQGE